MGSAGVTTAAPPQTQQHLFSPLRFPSRPLAAQGEAGTHYSLVPPAGWGNMAGGGGDPPPQPPCVTR